MQRRFGFLLAILLLGSVAAVGIENPTDSVPSTLYFHYGANQDFPINTQPPEDLFYDASGRGLLAPTTTCLESNDPVGVTGKYHTIYGFSTPSYVQYDFTENGGPRIHPERGLSSDLVLDTATEARAWIYIETQFDGGSEVLGGAIENVPTFLPNVVAEVTVRQGDDVGIGDASYERGELVAYGKSDAITLDPQSPAYINVNGANVYELQVPIEVSRDRIDQREGFNVRIDVRMDVPGCDDKDAALSSGQIRYHTSSEYRPKLQWNIKNPVFTEYLHPEFIGNQLFIHAAFNSPYGNYDVDETLGGIEILIDGPTQATRLMQATLDQKFHEHNQHFEPVFVTYIWPFQDDEAVRDEYTLRIEAWNDQRTAKTVATASFDLRSLQAVDAEGNVVEPQGQVKEAPGVGLVPIALVAVALAVLRRRA